MRPPAPAPRDGRLVVGLVRGLHALRGAVRVEILSDDPARFEPGSVLYPEGEDRPLSIVWAQTDGPGILLRFREVTTRSAAEPLRDRYLEADVPRDALAEGTYYWHELVGAGVRTQDGERLGAVRDVFRAGGAEVLVVDGGDRGEILIPAVASVVVDFAPRDGRIVVDREGLGLDDEVPAPRPRGRRTTRAARSAAGAARSAAGAAPAPVPDADEPTGDDRPGPA